MQSGAPDSPAPHPSPQFFADTGGSEAATQSLTPLRSSPDATRAFSCGCHSVYGTTVGSGSCSYHAPAAHRQRTRTSALRRSTSTTTSCDHHTR